jgi:hypothetical protein
MIKAIRSIGLAALIIVATTAGSTITDDKAPPVDATSKFLVGTVKTDVTMPPEVQYEKLFNEKLTDRLKHKKLLAEPGDPNAMVIDSRITQYSPGNVGDRFIPFAGKGEATVSVTSNFGRGGKSLGSVTVQNGTGGGMGMYAIGADGGVIEDAAELLVDDLAKKAKGD